MTASIHQNDYFKATKKHKRHKVNSNYHHHSLQYSINQVTHKIFTVLLLLIAGQFTQVYTQQVFTEQGVSIEFGVMSKPVAL